MPVLDSVQYRLPGSSQALPANKHTNASNSTGQLKRFGTRCWHFWRRLRTRSQTRPPSPHTDTHHTYKPPRKPQKGSSGSEAAWHRFAHTPDRPAARAVSRQHTLSTSTPRGPGTQHTPPKPTLLCAQQHIQALWLLPPLRSGASIQLHVVSVSALLPCWVEATTSSTTRP